MNKIFLSKALFFLLFLVNAAVLNAQNVGINTTGATPHADAILDLNTGNAGTFGFLAPHVSLPNVASASPFTPPVDNGLLVYDTNAGTTGGNGVGYYYWSGSIWLYVYNTGPAVNTWQLLGNAGTNPGTNFIGTTDNNALILKTFNTEGLRITSSGVNNTPGNVGVGNIVPQQNLSVNNAENIDQSGQNNGFFNNGNSSGNALSFGSSSGEGIASNRNSSVGYEKNGLQFYTDFQLVMNISNIGSGVPPGQVAVINGLNVDQAGDNNGFLDNGSTTGNGLTFGALSAGEGIASKRTPGGNQNGLDFYTDYINRITVTNGGSVGIGTTTPKRGLELARDTTTERIDGLKTGNTFNSSATASTSNLMYINNTTGDIYALPTVNNATLVTNNTGVPSWQTTNGIDWSLTGNSGTSPGTNFMGTTDNKNVVFKRDNVQGGLLDSASNNTSWGTGALNPATSGNQNTANGYYALSSNTSGSGNTAMGEGALYNNVAGNFATAIGANAMYYANNSGSGFTTYNVAVGYDALEGSNTPANNTGTLNTAVGYKSLTSNTSGSSNAGTGEGTLLFNTTGSANTALGYQALFNNVAGNNATAIGYQAMSNANNNGSSFITYNVAVGYQALQGSGTPSDNTGIINTAVGYKSLLSNTSGSYNTGIGDATLLSNTTGSNNSAFGQAALYSNTTGNHNTASGDSALYSNTSGLYNAATGEWALLSNTTGNDNTAMGNQALFSNTTGAGNTAVGYQALFSNTNSSLPNTAVGFQALFNNTSGQSNTAIGNQVLFTDNTGFNNTGVGDQCMKANTTGTDCSGYGALNSLDNTTGFRNSSFGMDGLEHNTTGSYNCSLGYGTLANNTTGNKNTAIGYASLQVGATDSLNTALGYGAFTTSGLTNSTAIGYLANATASNQIVLGNNAVTQTQFNGALMPYYGAAYNAGTTGQILTSQGPGVAPQWKAGGGSSSPIKDSAWLLTGNAGTTPGTNFMGTTDNKDVVFKQNGIQAGLLNSSLSNTSWGVSALNPAASGVGNTASGYQALEANTGGAANTASGMNALKDNTGGNWNTANGFQALFTNINGEANTGIGFQALAGNTGDGNTATGFNALEINGTGFQNTANGLWALNTNSIGSSNTALGAYAGTNNLSNQNVYLGDSAGYANSFATNDVFLGYKSGPASPASNTIYLGNTSTTAIEANSVTSITAWSDRRVKDSIRENVPGLAFITKLQPVTFHYNIHKEDELLGIKNSGDYPGKYDVEKITQSGFIAQQVDSAAQACGYNFAGVDKPKTPGGLYALGYTDFVVPLVKAVQELNTKNDSLQAENVALKAQVNQQTTAEAQDKKALNSRLINDEQEISELKQMIYSSTQIQASAKPVKP